MQVTLFNRAAGEQLPVATKTNKSGAVSVGYLSKKAYGEQKGLKGAALRRAHEAYRVEFGMAGNVNVSAMMTKGEIIAQKVTTTKDGFKVAFVRAGVLGVQPQPKPEEAAAQLSTEQLLAIINARSTPAPAVQAVA